MFEALLIAQALIYDCAHIGAYEEITPLSCKRSTRYNMYLNGIRGELTKFSDRNTGKVLYEIWSKSADTLEELYDPNRIKDLVKIGSSWRDTWHNYTKEIPALEAIQEETTQCGWFIQEDILGPYFAYYMCGD